jgi:transposase
VSAPVPGCPGCEVLQARLREAEAAFAARIAVFEAQFEALQAEVLRLRAEVAELNARLNQNSGNSSRPPSSDSPDERAKRPKPPPSGRKPGGQPGHKGTTRFTFAPEAVAETLVYVPQHCAGCGAVLPGDADPRKPEPPPRIHQVADLPEIKLHVTEFRLHARSCPCCGRETWAELPPGVPMGNWGPGVQALAALLTGYFRLSRRRAGEFLTTLLGDAPCVGTLISLEAATVRALAAAVAEAATAMAEAAEVNVDETGWRRGRDRPTLWVAVNRQAALFRIGRRDAETFKRLLPALPPGRRRVIGSDRYVVYDGVETCWRQLCWAHLKRNFQALTELGSTEAKTVGNWALAEIRKLFHHWRQFREGLLRREELLRAMKPVQEAFRALLAYGAGVDCKKTRNLCTSLQERWEALWTFVERENVEPTNNAAERALRGAVLWRKGSFGHKSDGGEAFVETMLTVCGSLRLQGRGVMTFVQAACRAALTGEPMPKLAPGALVYASWLPP